MAQQEARKITQEEAQNIVGTGARVIIWHEPEIIGRLISAERVTIKTDEKGIERKLTYFRFQSLDGKEALVPAQDLRRLIPKRGG